MRPGRAHTPAMRITDHVDHEMSWATCVGAHTLAVMRGPSISGAALVLTGLAFDLAGDGLQDALAPRGAK